MTSFSGAWAAAAVAPSPTTSNAPRTASTPLVRRRFIAHPPCMIPAAAGRVLTPTAASGQPGSVWLAAQAPRWHPGRPPLRFCRVYTPRAHRAQSANCCRRTVLWHGDGTLTGGTSLPTREARYWTRPGLLVWGGAPRRNRTGDPILTMDVLYRLS